jgi:uncharacterized protein (DUF1697 family)
MPRYVALLRGINVGGHRVKMDHLRSLFGDMGFDDVATFIASGNVIFSTPSEDPSELESAIEKHLHGALGYEVATFVRTPAELLDTIDIRGDEANDPDHSVYVTFTQSAPADTVRNVLVALESGNDRFEFHGREVYWLICGKLSASPLFKGNDVAKVMKSVPHTARNITSLQKLLAKLGPE